MNLDLSNKNAIVCGSTQGLGFATAYELSLLGANITLVARNESSLQETLKRLDSTKGQRHNYFVADFSKPEEVRSGISGHLEKYPVVHILVNNTGGPAGGAIIEAKPEEFAQAFSNHLICNHILTQACVPSMKAERFGRIINIISTSVKQPITGLGVSNTTRGAVASWAKTLANELGQFGITVNNVLPGYTKTARLDFVINSRAKSMNVPVSEMERVFQADIPAGRFGEASEFGAVAAFLCSPAAAYVNGVNIPVDGGRVSSL
ncbi:3-oxoacyl-[acyl-carrier protein] reductase [Pseudarcicella hirudinis]|uniref:3-oxoacyl-[acyl-carrier protein] reductase n=1 Tax=Pseudarcicella hirudinis TaxID=1079859 RepID=A0A1I5UH35_9BACT|nr:SDR family oxidoreductase [Pseudarcicella hirudinis]SFP94603.1 3-oxoacyl-[acyl-carrier protein] reductase [Pseudarcicella hirudinis]